MLADGFLALFEFPEMYKHFIQGFKIKGFFRQLADAAPERRLWTMVLLLLVANRVITCIAPTPVSMAHCSAVHIIELVMFGAEKLVFKGGGDALILGVIAFNAVFFTYLAFTIE